MRLAYVTRQLEIGGAERQLFCLVQGLCRTNPVWVFTLYEGGKLWTEFAQLPSVRLLTLNRKGLGGLSAVYQLSQILKKEKIDLIHTYLSLSHTIGLLAASIARTPVKVVAIRDCGIGRLNWSSRVSFQTDRVLTNLVADRVISNSHAGKQYHVRRGYRADKISVISNGIDAPRFDIQLDVEAEKARLGLPPDAQVVGMVAGIKPIKDHPTFLKAAALLTREFPKAFFLIIGEGDPFYVGGLKKMVTDLTLEGKVIFTGVRKDIPRLLQVMDVAVLTSFREGFPNSVAEAMAAGKPVVTNDVGDLSEIVQDGKCGFLAALGDAGDLATKIGRLLSDEVLRRQIGQQGKQRIANRYSVEMMVTQTEQLYADLLRQGQSHTPNLRK